MLTENVSTELTGDLNSLERTEADKRKKKIMSPVGFCQLVFKIT